MSHLHPTNHSCPQSNVCRTTGRCEERENCLSCAGRYQPNRRRCLPLRAEMMMIMCVCVCASVCVYGYELSAVMNLCVRICVHINFFAFRCVRESENVWQSNRSSGQVDES